LKQLQENLDNAQQVIAEHETQARYTVKFLSQRAKQALDVQYDKYCENLNEKDSQIQLLIEAYEQQITQNKADLDGRATEINRLRQSQFQDQEQIEYIRQEITSYETYSQHLPNQYEQLRLTHEADLIQLQTITSKVKELERLNEKSQVETSNTEAELKEQLPTITQSTSQLQEDNNQLKYSLVKYNEQFRDNLIHTQNLQDELHERIDEITNLKNTKTNLRREIAQLKVETEQYYSQKAIDKSARESIYRWRTEAEAASQQLEIASKKLEHINKESIRLQTTKSIRKLSPYTTARNH
jgi:chromosome segregation ATPase